MQCCQDFRQYMLWFGPSVCNTIHQKELFASQCLDIAKSFGSLLAQNILMKNVPCHFSHFSWKFIQCFSLFEYWAIDIWIFNKLFMSTGCMQSQGKVEEFTYSLESRVMSGNFDKKSVKLPLRTANCGNLDKYKKI